MDLNTFTKFLLRLFPSGLAFSAWSNKRLRQLITGLAALPQKIHEWLAASFLNILPSTTTEISKWSDQFGSPENLSVQELDARWAEVGSLTPHEMQVFLQSSGFTDCYVHEWWASVDPIVSRDPSPYIDAVESNLLVNLQYDTFRSWSIECGDGSECGDPALECGIYSGFKFSEKQYGFSSAEDERPYYFYVCGQTFGEPAVVSENVDRLKELIYKKKGTHLRCVLIYVSIGGIQDIVDDGITDGYQDIVDDGITDGIQDIVII